VRKRLNLCGRLLAVGSAISTSQMDGKFTPVLLIRETRLSAKHI
jgi:hypothetical protein